MQKVVFQKSKEVPAGSMISVVFERGDHSECTADYPVMDFNDGTSGVIIDEELELGCTMYKDTAGKFQVRIFHLFIASSAQRLLVHDYTCQFIHTHFLFVRRKKVVSCFGNA